MKKGYLYILLDIFIFSTMEIAGKIASNGLNPFQLTFLRFLIGGLILLPSSIAILKDRNIHLGKKEIKYFTLAGFFCVVVSMSFFQLAIVYTKASTVAVLFSTNPVFTIPFAYFILKEDLKKSTIVSIIISLIGIAWILDPMGNPMSKGDLIGIVFAILAALSFSLYSVIVKLESNRYGSIAVNCFAFLFGDAIMLILMLISKLPFIAVNSSKGGILGMISNIPIISGVNYNNIMVLLYLGIFVTGIGYLLYFLAMDQTSVVTASLIFFAKPAVAPVLALIILNEVIPINTIVGIGFILISSFVMLKSKSNHNNKHFKLAS